MRHATDPDHVLAISTIVSRDPRVRRAVRTGMFWGLGHTLTVIGVGAAMLMGRLTVPPGAVLAMDLLVALMLVVLGAVGLRARPVTHAAEHAKLPAGARLLASPLRAFAVGIVHGLAGSAAVTLLALTTIGDRGRALAYLALFGVGTVAGMMLITLAIAVPLTFAAERMSQRMPLWIARASGALSIAAGLTFAVRSLLAP
ncbi:high-affinity nickel-transport family protein [Pendulispora albinea]|uniref:High-affinity nickel-transport family protein n=2 Tax=Pendulispora albinea TaxID=2741071 RepID=A0ABZ2LNS3_9BACT